MDSQKLDYDRIFHKGVSINQLAYIEDVLANNILGDRIASAQIEEPKDCSVYWEIVDELIAKQREENKKFNPYYYE